MTALRWESAGPDLRIADGRYCGEHYELRRHRSDAWIGGRYWETLFFTGCTDYDGSVLPPQRLRQGNFVQARAAAIKHYNTPAD